MKEKIITSKSASPNSTKEKLALHYLSKYIKELQLHFNLSDESLKQIVYKASTTIKGKNTINKIVDMIKSFW